MVIAPPPAPAVPQVATIAPVTIPDLVEMTTLSGLAISPDGNWVAFRSERNSLARNRLIETWYVVPVDGSAPARPIGDGGEGLYDTSGIAEPEVPVWSPASNAVFYRALVSGEIQVWRAPVDGSGATRLTSDPANIRTLALGEDGQSLVYTADATRAAIEQAESDAYDEGTPGDGSADLVDQASRGWFVDGRLASRRSIRDWVDYGHLLWRTPSRTVHVALAETDWRNAAPSTNLYAAVEMTRRWEAKARHWRLVVTPTGRAPIPCTAVLCDQRGPMAMMRLPGRQDYVVTLRNTARQDVLASWDPGDQSTRVIKSVQGTLTGGVDNSGPCLGTADALVCVLERPASPPSLVRIAIADGTTQTLFAPNADLESRVRSPMRALGWKDHNGIEHSAQLILPTGPRPSSGYPLVFTYYVCEGFLRGGTGGELPLIPLAQSGIATLCINRARSDLAHQNWPADQRQAQEDIEAVIGQLAREGLIDRRHIGEWGYSFGSEVMSQILIHTNLLAAAASASNLLDPTVYWFESLPGRSYPTIMRSAFHLGPPDSDVGAWRKTAPVLNLDKVRTPLLIQAPEREARSMIELWSKLSRGRTPAELWEFANEAHTKLFPRHIAVSMTRNMDWFRYWLDHQRDPDPGKRVQYGRWDSLARRWTAAPRRSDRARP